MDPLGLLIACVGEVNVFKEVNDSRIEDDLVGADLIDHPQRAGEVQLILNPEEKPALSVEKRLEMR
jgi:hypothetical protein